MRVGPESRYTKNRHSFASIRASDASLPYTDSSILSPPVPRPANCSTPQTWLEARVTSVTSTFRSEIHSATSAADGRPSGEPTTRCTAAATPQPTAMLDIAFTGSAAPPQTPASTASGTRNHTSRCTGRLRYGSAMAATATATASQVTG